MFNTQLKAKLDALCTDIAAHLDLSEAAGVKGAAPQRRREPQFGWNPIPQEIPVRRCFARQGRRGGV